MEKLKHLDGLRGLASLIVVIHHYACAFLPAIVFGSQAVRHFPFEVYLYSTPLSLFFNGNFAVTVFFALSGFVLTYRFFLKQDHEILVRSAAKRYFRLMPPAAVSILAAYIILKTGNFYNLQIVTSTHSSMWMADIWNFTASAKEAAKQALYGVFISENHTYNTNLWTMKYEFMGSFMVFGIASLFGKMQRRYLVYAVLCLVFIKSYYLSFVLGMAVADIWVTMRDNERFNRIASSIAPLSMLLGLLVGSYPLRNTSDTVFSALSLIPLLTHDELFVFWHNLGAVLLVAGFLYSYRARHIFSSRIFAMLGKHSFSLYLVHLIVIGSFSSYLFIALSTQFGYLTSLILMFIISMVLIFAISILYTRYVDEPSTLLASRIGNFVVRKSNSSPNKAQTVTAIPQQLKSTPSVVQQ